jgi:hypothetical protein
MTTTVNEAETRAKLNQALCLMLVAGENKDFVEGHVYAQANGLGIELELWNIAKAIALRQGLIVQVMPHEYRSTSKGNVICEQIKKHFNIN